MGQLEGGDQLLLWIFTILYTIAYPIRFRRQVERSLAWRDVLCQGPGQGQSDGDITGINGM
jgi:hypothetical protein